ncbi:hypothetical protein ACQP2E_14160 [Actinoplanes sp. CA-015351]|uniref:hypothetical protein n=1 Tax=Actinoplanes sp. CA-015351 TaxID=3239897 RepID=UPI003D98A6D6
MSMTDVVPKWKAVVLDFVERGGWSAGQVFFATLLAGGITTVAKLPWGEALTLAVSAFVSSIVLTGVQYLSKQTNLAFWPDLVVRLAKTFLSSLSASILAGAFNVTTFDWETAFNVAFLATLGSLGKGLLAREPAAANGQVPPDASPSTLPTGTYREAVDHAPAPPTIAATNPPEGTSSAGSSAAGSSAAGPPAGGSPPAGS